MNYIIDGYNLGFKINSIATHIKSGNLDLAIQKLTQFVRTCIKDPKSKVLIVLDGQDSFNPKSINKAGIKLVFSKKPQTADDIIRDFIRKTKQLKNWCIVSSDNEIIYTAKDHGARTMKSIEFTNLKKKSKSLSEQYKKKTNPQNIDLDYWRSVFGDEE